MLNIRLHLQHILTRILEDNSGIMDSSVVTVISSCVAIWGKQANCTALISYFRKLLFALCVPVQVSV